MSAPAAASAVPYLPLTRPTLDEETIAGVVEVLRSGWITSGPNVKALEGKLSEYFGGRPVRVFNSGTCTMEIALRIAGVGAGHEVITTPLSWVATSNVILEVGARPVFVDIDPVTRNLDLDLIEAAITPATRAIIPVDLAGLPVDRDRLYAIAKKHGLRIVEDAAQSMGSTWNGKRIGATGDFVSVSFHPNKNITTIEGGCLVMTTEAEAKLAEQYRLQGVVRSGLDGMEVEVVGGKFNLTDVAARVGLGQLPRLEEFNGKRRGLARGGLGAEQLAHVSSRAAAGREAGRGHGGAARGGDRQRRALPGDPPVCPVSAARLEGGRFSESGSRVPQHFDPAAVSGDDACGCHARGGGADRDFIGSREVMITLSEPVYRPQAGSYLKP